MTGSPRFVGWDKRLTCSANRATTLVWLALLMLAVILLRWFALQL